MGDDTDLLSRRRVLQLSGSALVAGIAGCNESPQSEDLDIDTENDDDDYRHVDGYEIAARQIEHIDTGLLKTEARVDYISDPLPIDRKVYDNQEEKWLQQYEAHPEGTDETFTVVDHDDGPLYQALGREIHEEGPSEDVYRLFGEMGELTDYIDTGSYDGGMSERDLVFFIHDAEIVEE